MNRHKMNIVIGLSVLFLAISIFPSVARAHNGPFDLGSMVILTDEDIIIPGYFDVSGGNLCSRTGDITLGGKGTVRVPIGACADTSSDVIAATGTITLNNFARVAHTRGNVVIAGTVGICTNLKDAAIPCPANPPFPTFTAGTNDITCTPAGTNISPGSYGDLIIQQNGVCNFQGPGDYNFVRIVGLTPSHYSLNFVAPSAECNAGFDVNVKEFVFLPEFGAINPTDTPSVHFNVEGADGTYGGANKSPIAAAFTFMGDGPLNVCSIFVPNGTIGLRGISRPAYTGQFIGKRFVEISTLRVTVDPPNNPECCGVVTKECACISDFFDKTDLDKTVAHGGTLRLIGNNFSSQSVSNVLFFLQGNNPDITNPLASANCVVPNTAPGFTFVSSTIIDLTIPATCPAGNYHIGIVNADFSVIGTVLLTITP